MLKKTGIVVAAATAGLLAFSPLAFATNNTNNTNNTDNHKASAGDCNISQSTGDARQTAVLGLVSLNDVLSDAQVAVPICDNNVNLQVIPIESPVTQNNQ